MEIIYGLMALILLCGIAYGAIQYSRRNKSKDAMTERATREVYAEGSEPGSEIRSPETAMTSDKSPS